MPEEIEEIEGLETGGSKLPMILSIVAALILGLGGGYGISMVTGAGADSESADVIVTDGGSENLDNELYEEHSVDRGIYPLGLFTVNLRGVGGGRVLRVEIEVEVSLPLLETIEERRPGLRDATIKLISDYSYTDVEGLDGKLRMQDALLQQLNTYMGRTGRIERVYFSQFVVQ
jgi:flagellar basal body-associated protein FliL